MALVWLACVVLVVVVAARWVVGSIIARELREVVENNLHAQLRLGPVRYHFPMSASIENATLVALEPDGTEQVVASVGRIDLALARLPLRDGPIRISGVTIDQPTFNLIRNVDKSFTVSDLAQRRERDPTRPKRTRRPLSDLFELRKLTVRGGEIRFEDRSRPDSVVMVWQNISTDLKTDRSPEAPGAYRYDLTLEDTGATSFTSTGVVDIDALSLDAQRVMASLHVGAGQPTSQLPAFVQDILARYQIGGKLTIDGSGKVALSDLNAATWQASVALAQGSATLPADAPVRLDSINTVVKLSGQASSIQLNVDTFDALVAGAGTHLTRAAVSLDLKSRTWRMTDSAGSVRFEPPGPRDAPPVALAKQIRSYNPRGQINFVASASGPLEPDTSRPWAEWYEHRIDLMFDGVAVTVPDIETPVQITGGQLGIVNGSAATSALSGSFGADTFEIGAAIIPLSALPDRFVIERATGRLFFDRAAPPHRGLPGPVGQIFASLRPTGEFPFEARASIALTDGQDPHDFNVVLSPLGKASLRVTDKVIELGDLRGSVFASPVRIDMPGMTGTVLGGTFKSDGRLELTGTGDFSASVDVRDVNQNQLGLSLGLEPQTAERLKGSGFLVASVSGKSRPEGNVPIVETIRGSGTVEVLDGDLWQLPILKRVVDQVKVAREALTAGEAAARFEVESQTVRLRRAAINAPVLGLQARGTIKFDGTLDLNVIATPLADWKEKVSGTNIPIVSDVAGAVAGTVQRGVNAATRNFLYQFSVTGPVSDPKITPIPVPILTKGAANLFDAMTNRKGRLKDALEDEAELEPQR